MAARKTATSATKTTGIESILPDIEEHPLVELIPSRSYATSYQHRKIGGREDFEVFDAALAGEYNICMTGPTGSGKTSVVYAFGAERGLPVLNIPCNGAIDVKSLFGGKVQDEETGMWTFRPGDLYLLLMFGGILYFNEGNMMSGRISAAFHSVSDRRRILTVPEASGSDWPTHVRCAPGQVLIIMDYNPGYADSFEVNAAWKNRFSIKMPWDYSPVVEQKLVVSESLRKLADAMRKKAKEGELRTPISTNMLMELEELTELLGFGFAVENFLGNFEADERAVVDLLVNNAFLANIKNDLGIK